MTFKDYMESEVTEAEQLDEKMYFDYKTRNERRSRNGTLLVRITVFRLTKRPDSQKKSLLRLWKDLKEK